MTGVIYVTTEAQRLGFGKNSDPDWVNLGQGMPECGPLPGSAPRVESLIFDDLMHEYAPIPGIWELRDAVAQMYNRRYRRGMKSQYTAENVAISGGGRVALARAAAALGHINLGHFLPDYTAYEELLDIFRLFTPIPISLESDRGYSFSAEELRREIVGRGISAILFSNPSNPTGRVIDGQELEQWIYTARSLDCTLLIDEFYSHYLWKNSEGSAKSARYVTDVDKDPVVFFDGLTKNWRYAGWRISWTVGPRSVIEAVSSAGSFLDGGAPRPLQKAGIPLLEDSIIDTETQAIRSVFGAKREILLKRCREMGMHIPKDPEGTFYVFADLSKLPEAISSGMSFFQAALKEKVICVPGEFFDVNPGKRRRPQASRFHQYVRLSFGPTLQKVELGCQRLEKMIRQF